MASWIVSLLSFFWPSFSNDDLYISKRLVQSLPIQPSTRYFTLALQDPQRPKSVLYILSTMLLSEQSASDADDLINAVKPNVVVAQVGSDAMEVIHMEHLPVTANLYPKSILHVIRESFHDGNSYAKYMKMAQADVIKAIFGTTFMGHVVAAKHAAKELRSEFYYLECPVVPANGTTAEKTSDDNENPLAVAHHVASSLGSSFFGCSGARSSNWSAYTLIAPEVNSSLSNALAAASPSLSRFSTQEQEESSLPETEYKCPEYAQVVYPFLAELYNTYRHLPGMGLAIQGTQKLLTDVEKGEVVDHSHLSICQCFRLAAEGLRVALNSSAYAPLKLDKVSSPLSFDELPYEDKCYVLLAQALKQQLQKSQCVVAVLDAGMVAGVRKYWTFSVPDDVAAMAMECLISEADEDSINEAEGSKSRILDKPLIVMGAGAAAAFGVASFSQWAPASTAMKILSFKVPTIFKLGLLQAKKGTVSTMAKAAHPLMKSFMFPGKGFLATKSVAGSKISLLKAVANTGNIRTAAHSVIATAEKASYSAIRTAFYNAMQNRHRKNGGGKLWLCFGASVAACAGLLAFGQGIENVIEIVPAAYSISNLCQGVSNLSNASNELMQFEDKQYWETMYSRLYRQFKHSK
ncbi:hypothetical protein GOP47_0004630 [Adiantum capillus-veneris]|uniref:Uncharacterized protein n=1 Tax=Adiantum capillus-veneris TaxID=13818 RepID=A0A9D4V9M0_ADICA|nr:hypothetical protein GOP47_0004630 [Adiantum capillus-veneris]